MNLIRKIFKDTPDGWATNSIERKSCYAFFVGQNAIYALVTSYLTICFMLKGYSFLQAEVEYVPSTYTKLTNEDDITNMNKMLDMFEDNNDVQNVWHNWEMED